jgi:molybdopterin-guanine dinucleotide biosynthesis protein A
MTTWEHILELPASAAAVFAVMSTPSRRSELSPPAWKLTLVEGPPTLARGSKLHWKLRRAGVTQSFVTEITTCEPPKSLVEEQRQGALRHWSQATQLDEVAPGRTRIRDVVTFEPPGGILGLAVTKDSIRRDLEASFQVRDEQLREMFPETRVAGVVLCGGRSSRMGRPKAWLPFGGEPLLTRVVRVVAEATSPVIVVAAPGQELPPLSDDIMIVRDEVEGRGPLQGIAAGLRAAQGRADAVYLSSCDVPFLKSGWIRRMIDLLGDHAICVPKVGDYHHPLAAVYRTSVLKVVDRLLAANRMRPVFLFDEAKTRIVTADELAGIDAEFESLRNLNTPDDYASALRRAGEV